MSIVVKREEIEKNTEFELSQFIFHGFQFNF